MIENIIIGPVCIHSAAEIRSPTLRITHQLQPPRRPVNHPPPALTPSDPTRQYRRYTQETRRHPVPVPAVRRPHDAVGPSARLGRSARPAVLRRLDRRRAGRRRPVAATLRAHHARDLQTTHEPVGCCATVRSMGSHLAIVKSVCLSVPLVNCGQTVADRHIVTIGRQETNRNPPKSHLYF